MFLFSSTGSAAPASVNVNGKIYYIVSGNDPTMDTGAEVCASIGKICKEYGTIGTNAVCVKFHPTSRALSILDGSKAEFFCDGPPQTGVCGNLNMKNVCAVCPKCSLNEASTCNQPIGQHFREMYVECLTPKVKRSSSSSRYSSRRSSSSSRRSSSRRSSSSSSSRRSVIYTPPTRRGGQYGPLPLPRSTPGGQDPRIGQHPGKVICEFYQMTNPGDYAKSNKKLVTCAAFKAADHFCTIAMQSQYARAERCDEQGIIICSNPCTPPTYQLPIQRCAADNDRARGINASPISFCGSASPRTTPAPAKKNAGELCQHGGDCTSGMCLGVVPGREYRCSCVNPTTRWQSCIK